MKGHYRLEVKRLKRTNNRDQFLKNSIIALFFDVIAVYLTGAFSINLTKKMRLAA